MRRALETAEPVSARLGLEMIIDEELAEFDRDSHFYIPIEELKEEKDERWDDLIGGRWGSDGEINAYFAHLLKLDFPMFFEPAYTSISRVLASSGGHRQVKSINEHAHVRELI
jgi:hypothetical protein